jgi:hypothetical protein
MEETGVTSVMGFSYSRRGLCLPEHSRNEALPVAF